MKVLLTGATGFLGHAIARNLALRGHDLVILSRDDQRAKKHFPYPADFFQWDAERAAPPQEAFAGVEGVIHLAGEPVAAKRWTSAQRKRILDSRVLGTRQLWQGIAKARESSGASLLQSFVSASAIGYYGDRGDEALTESAAAGKGFLAQVCTEWEREIFQLGFDEVRKVAIRIGIVLGREGGALEKLLPIFRSGLGGPVGRGTQWMSWIHLDDLAWAFVEALEQDSYRGPVNAVAPHPVTQAEFARSLGEVLRRPAILPVPSFALQAGMGAMASVVLEGQRVKPEKLLKNGFVFKFRELPGALADLCAPQGDAGVDEFFSEQWVNRPVDKIFPFFAEAKNLEALTPPCMGFKVTSMSTPEMGTGTLIDYKLSVHGVPMRWRTLIEDWRLNDSFVDTQLQGPYAKWHHTHTFLPMKGGTLMRDRVLYRLPLGILGKRLAHWKVRNDIEAIFSYRRKKITELFGP
jgi:uncharacterized protein (TIGR01777 family)